MLRGTNAGEYLQSQLPCVGENKHAGILARVHGKVQARGSSQGSDVGPLTQENSRNGKRHKVSTLDVGSNGGSRTQSTAEQHPLYTWEMRCGFRHHVRQQVLPEAPRVGPMSRAAELLCPPPTRTNAHSLIPQPLSQLPLCCHLPPRLIFSPLTLMLPSLTDRFAISWPSKLQGQLPQPQLGLKALEARPVSLTQLTLPPFQPLLPLSLDSEPES